MLHHGKFAVSCCILERDTRFCYMELSNSKKPIIPIFLSEGVQKWAAIHKVPRVMDVEIRGEVGEHLKHARRREKTKNRQN